MQESIQNLTIKKQAIFPALLVTILSVYAYFFIFSDTDFLRAISLMTGAGVGIFFLYGSEARRLFKKPLNPIKNFFLGFFSLQFALILATLVVKFLLHVQINQHEKMGALQHLDLFFFIKLFLMLMGEELLTFVLFFITASLLRQFLSAKKAILIGTIVSAVIFALLHLPAYHGNVLQVLVLIGTARLVLTWISLRSDSLWEGFAIHYVHDAYLILLSTLLLP